MTLLDSIIPRPATPEQRDAPPPLVVLDDRHGHSLSAIVRLGKIGPDGLGCNSFIGQQSQDEGQEP